jgi:signal transduction histidine kinase
MLGLFRLLGGAAGLTQKAGARGASCIASTGRTSVKLLGFPFKTLFGGPAAVHPWGLPPGVEERLFEFADLYGRICRRVDQLAGADPSSLVQDPELNSIVSEALERWGDTGRAAADRNRDELILSRPGDGGEIRLVDGMVFQDMMDLRKLQARLILARNLSWIRNVLGNVAHEMNSPLTVILGMSDLGVQLDLVGEPGEFFERILQEALRLKGIVGRLPKARRSESGDQAPVELHGILKQVTEMAAALSPTRGISIVTDTPDGPCHVPGLADDIRLAFLNIFENAVQVLHGERGGGTISVTCERDEERILVRIRDDGPGIEKGRVQKVFTPFFTGKGGGKRLGIGLSISNLILEHLGGEIGVETSQTGGTVFTVALPTAAAAAE